MLRALGILAFSLFGVVTAFGIAPATMDEAVAVRPLISGLALPDFNVSAETLPYSRQTRIEPGDTVAALLARLNVADAEALKFLKTDAVARTIFQLKPGKTVHATVDADGSLLALRYFNQADSALVVERRGAVFIAANEAFSEAPQLAFKSASIHSSLFGATDAADIPDVIAMQIAKIFSTSIDFHTGLRRNDHLSVVYEVYYAAGEPVRSGRVLAAEFNNDGNVYRALYFERQPGQGDYYTPDGKNLRKAFLRSPLEFSRVSSGYSMARFHPVLKNWRAHNGVDFAAPSGTRVLATADGIVSFVGERGGYGSVVEIKHQGQHTTLYAHLSGFAAKLRVGAQVQQSDVVGYVGATGLATGPHLHYEFKVAGMHRDPLGVGIPVAIPLPAQHLRAFNNSASALQSQLALIRRGKLSRFE